MKKTYLLLIFMLLAVCSSCFGEDLISGDYSYTILPDGTAEISGYLGEGTKLTVPESVDGITVTSIGSQTFARNQAITSVTLPGSVTMIGDHAFGECTALESVTLPDGLLWMGDGVFQGCVQLKDAALPQTLIRIGWNPFDRCDLLKSIEIPESNPFYTVQDGVLFDRKARSLVSYPTGKEDAEYTVPEWVTTIGMAAFSENNHLEEITLPDGLTEIVYNPFCGCTNLGTLKITEKHLVFAVKDNALFNNRTHELIAYLWGAESKSYSIPEGTTTIMQEAFYKHAELTSVTIPDSVRHIGNAAFAESGLISIRIPEGITALGDSMFSGCHNLMSVSLPRGLTSIGNSSFYECVSLLRINLPASLQSIGTGAFYLCRSLTKLEIPNRTEVIGNYAFAGCYNLGYVSFPESLTEIGEEIFYADEYIELAVPDDSFAEEWAIENNIKLYEEEKPLIQAESV